MKITDIKCRQILDSRGNPTVEVELKNGNLWFRGASPSGASTGTFEAKEIRDSKNKSFHGKSVQSRITKLNSIKNKLIREYNEPNDFDELLIQIDGTKDKSNLGANLTTALSIAFMRAYSYKQGQQVEEFIANQFNTTPKIPIPFSNVLNGGMHAGNKLAIQEFMIAPIQFKTFSQALQAIDETYQTLKEILVKKYGISAKNVGDEGGFAPNISKTTEAFNAIEEAINKNGYKNKIRIAIDAASTSFYNSKTKKYDIDGKKLSSDELTNYYMRLAKDYKLISIEDPFYEQDFQSFSKLKKKLNGIQIVGDDLTVTNPIRLEKAIENNSITTLLIKINQIGTVTESMECATQCKEYGLNGMVSHRSGETEDTFISYFATGLGFGEIKTGALARSERTAKYNQLLRLEEKGYALAKFKL
ncbi:Enolase [uncultured archaeon]|nr:Enolase [uncultured archaeon]